MSAKRIAIVGAGPIGLEAALYASTLGHSVRVYDSGRVGEHVRRWGHVRLFSPFRLNHSPLAARTLSAEGVGLPSEDAYLTGEELVERYLEPLARSRPLRGRVQEQVRVRQIGRHGIGKSDLIGGSRQRFPFRILLEDESGERTESADFVIDASGVYGNPNWLGDGNVPAIGERRLRERIDYSLQDIAGVRRREFVGRRVLLVGAGQSAATALDQLMGLDGTRIVWVVRQQTDLPFRVIESDPLPERERQSRQANRLAAEGRPRVDYRPATVVERISERGDRLSVGLRALAGGKTEVEVDRLLAHVGFGPDNSVYRELQIHECYATFGPMRLAAALLGDATTDCLTQTSKGADSLAHPEPNFYILGAKSYGRNSSFLIHLGIEQIRELFTRIEGRDDLDLYAA